MSIVNLVSGGLDSTLMAVLTKEEGVVQYPLFIDYGQLNLGPELAACQRNFERFGLPAPAVAELGGFGRLIPSGITSSVRHIRDEAFLPGRNLLFLTVAASYAVSVGATSVGIGLLSERLALFPDQTTGFLATAEALVARAVAEPIRLLAPLSSFTKGDVLAMARAKGVAGTYSCHAGVTPPCGVCIACREFDGLEV